MAAKNKQHSSDLVIVLLLFFVYAGCALMLCVLGASSYSQTVAVVQEGFNHRTGVLYVSQRVHQNDVGGGFRIDTFEGSDALVLIEQESGLMFETWIFVKDGFLSEQLIEAGGTIQEGQIQRIMPMRALKLSFISEDVLNVLLTTETGDITSMNIAVRSSGGTFNTSGGALINTPSMSFNDEMIAEEGVPLDTPPEDGATPEAPPATQELSDTPPVPGDSDATPLVAPPDTGDAPTGDAPAGELIILSAPNSGGGEG